MASLPQSLKDLLDASVVVVVCTVNPDGSPQASPVWATYDGDDLLISTVRGRRKERNWSREPRTSVVAYNPANPYEYVEVRGSVTLTEQGGPELIQQLSQKYTGGPYTMDTPDAARVVVRLTADRVIGR